VCMYIKWFMYFWRHYSYRYSFHIWGKTCDLCPFELGSLCLTWWFPVTSIYLQTKSPIRTKFHSLWLNNTLLYIYIYIYTTFS
jgi:hypothetical protein